MGARKKPAVKPQEGSLKDKDRKQPPRRPAPLAGNKRQRKSFFMRSGR
ncbi:MAG TPA: hypothetical protein V6D08_18135 [Candidatus Obscuribacterales bacterium]